MSETFHPGELFVYVNGDRWELGMVKRPCDTRDAYFCWYSRGDTASCTPTCNMHKLANADWTHIEQVLDDVLAANAARTMLILMMYLWQWDTAAICNKRCPAHDRCQDSNGCEFKAWVDEQMCEMGIDPSDFGIEVGA